MSIRSSFPTRRGSAATPEAITCGMARSFTTAWCTTIFTFARAEACGGTPWARTCGSSISTAGTTSRRATTTATNMTFAWSKLNLSALIQQGDFGYRGEQGLFESVGFKMFNLAGVAASNTNYVHFRIIESANENGASQYGGDFQGLYLAVEQLDDNFLEEHDLPDGNLYKMENNTGVGGIGGESNNQGDYPAVSDSSDLIDFKTTYQSAPQTADWWRQNFNLDSYYNYRSIVEAIHHYDIAGGKNYFYYLNPETNQVGDAALGHRPHLGQQHVRQRQRAIQESSPGDSGIRARLSQSAARAARLVDQR